MQNFPNKKIPPFPSLLEKINTLGIRIVMMPFFGGHALVRRFITHTRQCHIFFYNFQKIFNEFM